MIKPRLHAVARDDRLTVHPARESKALGGRAVARQAWDMRHYRTSFPGGVMAVKD